MTPAEYKKAALRSETEGVYENLRLGVGKPHLTLKLLTTMREAVRVAGYIDSMKKALIYGKLERADHVPMHEWPNGSGPGGGCTAIELSERLDKALSARPELGRLLHSFLGISGEAGELLDALMRPLLLGDPLDTHNVIEELGDVQWYPNIAYDVLGITHEEVCDKNVAKLLVRYPVETGYTDHHAENRDLEAERKALEAKPETMSLAELPPEEQANLDYEFDSFWKELVCNPDGSLNKEAIKRELSDFRALAKNCTKVYAHITGGAIDRPNVKPEAVIQAADMHYRSLHAER